MEIVFIHISPVYNITAIEYDLVSFFTPIHYIQLPRDAEHGVKCN